MRSICVAAPPGVLACCAAVTPVVSVPTVRGPGWHGLSAALAGGPGGYGGACESLEVVVVEGRGVVGAASVEHTAPKPGARRWHPSGLRAGSRRSRRRRLCLLRPGRPAQVRGELASNARRPGPWTFTLGDATASPTASRSDVTARRTRGGGRDGDPATAPGGKLGSCDGAPRCRGNAAEAGACTRSCTSRVRRAWSDPVRQHPQHDRHHDELEKSETESGQLPGTTQLDPSGNRASWTPDAAQLQRLVLPDWEVRAQMPPVHPDVNPGLGRGVTSDRPVSTPYAQDCGTGTPSTCPTCCPSTLPRAPARCLATRSSVGFARDSFRGQFEVTPPATGHHLG